MISYRITSAIIGLALFIIIYRLVRRGKLQEKYSVIWFIVGFVIFILGLFPFILDALARLTGITYAPTLLFVIAVGVLLIQNLHLTIAVSKNEIRLKELSQRVAVLQKLFEESADETAPADKQN
jgi:hypothetical protein